MEYTRTYTTPIGPVLLASNGTGLTGLWIAGQKYEKATLGAQWEEKPDLPVLVAAADWLDRYFAVARPDPLELPLAPAGTPFRKAVWDILCRVPYGTTVTYGDLAAALSEKTGKKENPHAVGGAVGHNPITIIAPCHRVVGKSGSPTGYAGGLAKKLYLLRHEGVDTDRFFVPKRGTAL